MKRNRPFFPVVPSSRFTHDEKSISQEVNGYENEIVGGISIRDMIVLEIFCSLASNASLAASGVTLDAMRGVAITQTDRMLADLGEM